MLRGFINTKTNNPENWDVVPGWVNGPLELPPTKIGKVYLSSFPFTVLAICVQCHRLIKKLDGVSPIPKCL